MWLKELLKRRLHQYVAGVMREETPRIARVAEQIRAFRSSAPNERQRYYECRHDTAALTSQFHRANVPTEDARIDIADFEKWRRLFPELDRMYSGSTEHIEKCIEHYVAYTWLGLTSRDVYVDVAASGSKWAPLLSAKGIRSYRMDLKYRPGIHGRDIGADASNTGLPDGFAGAMSLQCAFEAFRGDADSLFIHEAERLLSENGRLVIVPLYADEVHYILSSPYVDLSGVTLDAGAIRVWREDRYLEAFSRHYSPEAFCQRVYSQLGRMKGTVVHFTNLGDVQARYPGQRVYCHFMFYCRK